MKAMLLAAGRGERMRPLTDHCPKPLLEVGGKSLIAWQIERLVKGGFDEIVINHAWLGQMLEERLGDGRRFGARIAYSAEGTALETLGGIVKALPLLGDSPFVLASADIYTEFDYGHLRSICTAIATQFERRSAHLVLTDNPPYHPEGDMALANGVIGMTGPLLNYGNIGVFHPRLFTGLKVGQSARLFPWVYQFTTAKRVTGEHFRGMWENLGTPEQLAALSMRLA